MSIQPPPSARDVQEFQFRLLARLRLFSDHQVPLKEPLSLVAAASKFGLIFVANSTGFSVIETAKVIQLYVGVKKPAAEVTNFPRRSVSVGGQPSHLDISCDGLHLAVGYSANGASAICIYDITSFTAQTERVVNEVKVPAGIHSVSWNPGIPNLMAACMKDGSVAVYEFKDNSFGINSIPPEANATSICWSPKGKQIVVGFKNGTLNQFRPDLKAVKGIPSPQADYSVVSIQWLSTVQYAVVYSAPGTSPCLVIVNSPRNQPPTFINYDDITYSNGDNRLTQFYFVHQQIWNVLLVASSNSMEVGVLGQQGSDWEQWQLDDSARAELPLSPSRQETHPVGMALDSSVHYNLPWGENQQLPAMPLLLLLSHEGLLSLYWTVNVMQGAASVCSPPTPLLDTSGLYLFTCPQPPQSQPETPPKAQVQAVISPQVQAMSNPQMQPMSSPQMQAMSNPQVPVAAASPVAVASQAAPVISPLVPQWQQSPPTYQPPTSTVIVPKPETKPEASVVQGSWMTSGAPPTFMSSITQSVSAPNAVPAFSFAPATAASSAFSITPAAPPAFSLSSTSALTQTPFPVTPLQSASTDLFSKPGAFVSSSVPATASPPLITTPTAATVPAAPVRVETPVAPPSAPLPTTLPTTPEPEPVEENQELKEMRQALIQESIKEEISHFEQILVQQKQKIVTNKTVNAFKQETVENLHKEMKDIVSFIKELRETTSVQDVEAQSLRNFIFTSFSYIESMKTRLHLQNNPDYLSIQSPQGLDPMQSRRMDRIRTNLQFCAAHMEKACDELNITYKMVKEANKENRIDAKVPKVEAIYQTMVVLNDVLMKKKAIIDELEAKVRALTRRSVRHMLETSQNLEDSQTAKNDTELSKIAKDFLSLNLNKLKTTAVEDLQDSVSSLHLTNHNHSMLNCRPSPSGSKSVRNKKMELLQQALLDRTEKKLEISKRWLSPYKSDARQEPRLPIVNALAQTGSISSGQPVVQNTSPKTSTVVNEAKSSTLISADQMSVDAKQSSFEPPNLKSPFTLVSSTPKSSKFSEFNTINQISQAPVSSIGVSTVKHVHFAPQIQSNINTAYVASVTSSSSTVPSKPVFSLNSMSTTPSPATDLIQQTILGTSPVNTTKGFSFPSIATCQASSAFSPPSSFVSSPVNFQTPMPSSPQPFAPPFGKTFSFSSTYTGSSIVPPAPSTNLPVFTKPEPPKPLTSAVSSPSKVTASESSPASSPIATLSSFVFGIEPLKPPSESASSPVKSPQQSSETTVTQPFSFKVSNVSENKIGFGKDTGIFNQKPNVFALPVESKQDSKDIATAGIEGQKENTNEVKNQFSGAFKSLSSGSPPQKSFFEDIPQSTSTEIETTKSDQSPKSLFGGQKTVSSNVFSLNNVKSVQNQKSAFAGTAPTSISSTDILEQQRQIVEVAKPADVQAEDISPIIEVSLTPPKDGADTRTSLEKLSASKGIMITPVESPAEEAKSEADTSSLLVGSFSVSSFTTPPKTSQNIFGGSSSAKPSVTYEIAKPEAQPVIKTEDETTENKAVDEEKQSESTKPQSLFADTTVSKSQPVTSFTFSTSSLQATPPSTKSTQPEQGSGFTFGLKLPATVAASSATQTTQAASTFSFAQTVSQPTSTTFSFAVAVTNTSTTATSTFGFGNLSTGLSEDKSKSTTGFSFGQQTQTPIPTSKSIFGGFGNKPVETSNIFGQTSAMSGENKNLFGQTPSSSAETTNIFGQTSTTSESKSVFGQTPATAADKPPEFSFSLSTPTTTMQSSFFVTPATTSGGFFGQPICSPTSTAAGSPFGQPTSTAPVFGTPNPFGGTSTFGSKSTTFGQSGGSFFGQSSGGFGTSGGSVFGGGSPSVFGGNNVQQAASPFGQSPGGSGSIFGGSSFSAGGQSVGQTGFGTSAFQNKPAASAFGGAPAFGASPAFGGAPTFGGSPAFGSPPKLFGGPAAPPAFGGSPQQQSSTFENLANQNTMTFGNLAQNQQPGFGSVFSPPAQNPASPPAFPAANTNSVFGGSSFSSWR